MVDLVPLAANARQSIERAIADFRKNADGVNVEAAVTGLRLAGIEFDAKTLRVIAEADGTVRVAVTKLREPSEGRDERRRRRLPIVADRMSRR